MRLLTFIEPRPVARSKPVPTVSPDKTPTESVELATVQLGLPFAQGIAIVPVAVS